MKSITVAVAAAALFAVPALAAQPGAPRQTQPITLSTLQARIQAQFARTDANGDGFLTRAEVAAAAGRQPDRTKLFAAREQRQAKRAQRLARLDTNRDGTITPAERKARAAARGARQQANRAERQARRAQLLARLDTILDGTLSPAERQARAAARGADQQANRAERQAKRAQREAKRQALWNTRTLRINDKRFARLDANKDGRLSLAEVTAPAARRFQRLDANGDGAITREERRAARVQPHARPRD